MREKVVCCLFSAAVMEPYALVGMHHFLYVNNFYPEVISIPALETSFSRLLVSTLIYDKSLQFILMLVTF